MEPSITALEGSLNSPPGLFTQGIRRFRHKDEETDIQPGSPQDGLDGAFLFERPLQEVTQGSAHHTGVAGTSTIDQAGIAHHFTLGAASRGRLASKKRHTSGIRSCSSCRANPPVILLH